MKLKQLKLGVKLCILASLGLWIFFQHQTGRKLEQENRDLCQQVQQLSDTAAENERLSRLLAEANRARAVSTNQSLELVRLRGEVSTLRREKQALDTTRAPAVPIYTPPQSATNSASSGDSTNYWPRIAWQAAGYATPEAAVQSQLWAVVNGDLATFLTNITDKFRENLQADLTQRTESQVLASLQEETQNLRAMRVVERRLISEDQILLVMMLEKADGTPDTKANVSLNRVGANWMLADIMQPDQ